MSDQEQINEFHDRVQVVASLYCQICDDELSESGDFGVNADDLADNAFEAGWRFKGKKVRCPKHT